MDRTVRWLVFSIAFVALVLATGGGPGWGDASARAVLAVQGRHVAASPLYDILSTVATLIPAGEPGFRLGVLAALIGACTLVGIVAAVSALVPREPAAAFAPIALLAITPVFRDASAFAQPALLAASGAVWSIAFAARFARAPGNARDVASALAASLVVVGSAPWLGALWTIAIAAWLARRGAARSQLAGGVIAIGIAVVLLWITARGALPHAAGSLAATLAATGKGPAAIVVGAGLLGIGFGALTRMPNAAWLALLAAVAAIHEIVVGNSAAALVTIFALGVAIIPGAIVRAVAAASPTWKRNLLAAGAGVPLVAIAATTGAELRVDDPGASPAQLARDLAGGLPPGPGTFVATRTTSWLALDYAMVVAGARPDIAIAPPLPVDREDALVADTLRAERIAGADAAAFGRLDVRRAIARRRGFQLVGEIPERPSPVEPPAHYASDKGEEQSILLALERARLEAASGRLDLAARAVGLAGTRFNAADLAVLAATTVIPQRPAMFGLLPLESAPIGPWLYDLFGDDLAWVAGLPIPEVPADAPMPRRLHAKWRAILSGKGTPDDPDIAAMGPDAVAATKAVVHAKPAPEPEPAGSGSGSAPGSGSAASGSAH